MTATNLFSLIRIMFIPDAQEALEEACSTSISVLARSSVKEGLTRMEPNNKNNESLFFGRRENISDRRLDSLSFYLALRTEICWRLKQHLCIFATPERIEKIFIYNLFHFYDKLRKIHLKQTKKYIVGDIFVSVSPHSVAVQPEISCLHQTQFFSSIEQDKLKSETIKSPI